MTQQHPITPPPELIYEWAEDRELLRDPLPLPEYIANCAAQWGADQELEACIDWISVWHGLEHPELLIELLRAARRPKPPSLKKQALDELDGIAAVFRMSHGGDLVCDKIRRALEALPND